MLVLPTAPPTSAPQLQAALALAVAEFVAAAPGGWSVQIAGEFPAMKSIAIDLTSANLRPPHDIPRAAPGHRVAEISAASFSVAADPLRYGQAAIILHIDAANIRLAIDQAPDQKSALDLLAADSGRARIQTTQRDLESLAQSLLGEFAAKQGAKIERVELNLTQAAGRKADLSARVTLKKMFFTAVLLLTGSVAIDDALDATLTGLSCQGEGAIGSIAANAITPKLREFDGRSFPLASRAFGNIRLRNVQFTVGPTITVEAEF